MTDEDATARFMRESAETFGEAVGRAMSQFQNEVLDLNPEHYEVSLEAGNPKVTHIRHLGTGRVLIVSWDTTEMPDGGVAFTVACEGLSNPEALEDSETVH